MIAVVSVEKEGKHTMFSGAHPQAISGVPSQRCPIWLQSRAKSASATGLVMPVAARARTEKRIVESCILNCGFCFVFEKTKVSGK